MSAEITINKDYILVEPKEGINYREIRRAIARLFYVPGIPEKMAFGYCVKVKKSFPTMICLG
jgi:hypothetical protein